MVDGGGGTFSIGGTYQVGGTAGQPHADYMSGGTYTLEGAFWNGADAVPTSTPTPTPGPSTSTSTPTTVPSTPTAIATSTPASPALVGHVTWQGRPAQPNALHQLPITLTLKSAITEVNYPVQTTDASGFF